MRYAFFPGCSLEATAWDFNRSTTAVLSALKVELEEIPEWVCCGSTPAHATSPSLALALPVRNLQKAKEMGSPVLASCAMCYSRFRTANYKILHDPEERGRVARITEKSYYGDVPVHHVLDVLVNHVGLDTIRSAVKKPLKGLKVACYYGCLLTRPPEIAAFDNPEHPVCMDHLLEALGAEPVEWPYKTECCGASQTISSPEVTSRLCHRLLSMAREAGAECVAVACQMCQMNLDLGQEEAVRAHGRIPATPILYVTQLLGHALGLSAEDVGLRALITSPHSLLATIDSGAALKMDNMP